jgi:hypothetical protein
VGNTLIDFLRDLEETGFYGSVELKYEKGRLTVARKSETIKLDSRQSNCRNNRGTNATEHNN